ncbi:MAG: amidohydrolase family protein [Polyangiaceae bacterium]|nr:amidohydrolase family protein [Polyangiaceae bacterium]MCE7889332.1 N-ethylammeline chlorohydrolase [Sorangiineae bacterium PRO1]MCL4752184.1 amidohydrolase family protein [Myxococcales bacterium]
MTQVATTLVRGATLVTCDANHRVLTGDLLIRDGRIAALGRVRAPAGVRVLDAQGRVVLPGLVMAHVHLCQVLGRGMADDLPLLTWLKERIWPLEAAHDEASIAASAELGLTEMLLAGTTALLDLGTVHHHDVVFDACVRSGIRVVGGKTLMDSGAGVPKRLLESSARALADAERLERRWADHPSGRVHYAWIPRFILSCSERLIRGAAERARASNAVMHTHAAEHPGERAAVRSALGADDVVLLRRWGFSGSRASIAHGVQLTASQMRALAKDGTSVVHCPSANLKLGSGIAPVARLRAAGLTVGLGADGAPCNNNLDPWLEMRHAALVSSAKAGPGVLPARDVLRLATIEGAKVLGLEHEIGSLEVGKSADLVVVNLARPHVAPAPDPVSTLVYATQARDVEHVFVAGRPLVQNGELATLDAERVVRVAREQAPRWARRAKLA